MSNEGALRTFVAAIRAACDQFEKSLKVRVLDPPVERKSLPSVKHKERICRCGHVESAHTDNGCRTCAQDGTLGALGCPEFSVGRRKHAIASKTNGSSAGYSGPCERAILRVLAQHGPKTPKQIAVFAGYSMSGTFAAALTSLRSKDLITRGTPPEITTAGRKTVGHVDPLPVGEKLLEYWTDKLSPCEASVLEALRAYGDLTPKQAAEVSRYAMSGTFAAALTKLRTLGLITRGRPMKLAEELR